MKTPKLAVLGPGIALLLALLIFRVLSDRKPPAPSTLPPAADTAMLSPLSSDELIRNAPRLPLKREDAAIGPIPAGASPSGIRALVGEPLSIAEETPYHDEITEKDLPLTVWRYDGLEVIVLDGLVVQITATSPKWPSGRGLRAGDGLARALELHGAPAWVRDNELVYCWEADGSGFCPLVVSIGPGRKVGSIVYDGWPD